MAIDLHEGLLGDLRGENLAESRLSAACLAHEQDRLPVAKALLDENCEAFELLGWDYPRQVKLGWDALKDLTEILAEVALIDLADVK